MAKPKATAARLRLRLYVAGTAPNSVRAISNTRAMCEEHFAHSHEIEIVDLLKHPERAMADEILVTPTLLKLSPAPTQRVVGNMSDTAQLLIALGGE
jgi:circadian clock protein KaiB